MSDLALSLFNMLVIWKAVKLKAPRNVWLFSAFEDSRVTVPHAFGNAMQIVKRTVIPHLKGCVKLDSRAINFRPDG